MVSSILEGRGGCEGEALKEERNVGVVLKAAFSYERSDRTRSEGSVRYNGWEGM